MIETGTATLGIAAARGLRKKTNTTKITRATAVIKVRSVSRERAADGDRSVDDDSEIDVARQRSGEARQHRFDAVDRLDDVGAGLARQHDRHRRLAVGEAGVAQILHRIDDVGDVGEPHRGVVAVSDDQVAIVGGRGSPDRWRRSDSDSRSSSIAPFGLLALAEASAARTSSRPMP